MECFRACAFNVIHILHLLSNQETVNTHQEPEICNVNESGWIKWESGHLGKWYFNYNKIKRRQDKKQRMAAWLLVKDLLLKRELQYVYVESLETTAKAPRNIKIVNNF